MTQAKNSQSKSKTFSEARKMIAKDLYVPSKWGRVEVDKSGDELKVVYEYNPDFINERKEKANNH